MKGMLIAVFVLSITTTQTWGQQRTQDPTRPLSRFELRVKHQDLPDDNFATVTTFRLEQPVPFGRGWQLALRLDLPVVLTDRPGRDNPESEDVLGFGDVLGQGFILPPSAGRLRFGVGAQFIWPTASRDETGSGKYQLAPSLIGIFSTPELGKGSYMGLLLRDYFAYSGDDRRRDIHELSVQPIANINLSDQWFVASFPDIRINWEDGGRAFVPLNIMLGRFVSKSILTSVEFAVPIVDDYRVYDWQVEGRLGFFF